MRSLPKILAIGVCTLSLGAWSGLPGTELEDTTDLTPNGSSFQNALFSDYLELSKTEYNEGDYFASDFFAERAQVLAKGERTVQPVTTTYAREHWDIAPVHANLVSVERAKLVDMLDDGMRADHPVVAASAQSSFDCWVQELAENRQPDDIAACRNLMVTAMNSLTQFAAAETEDPKVALVVMKPEQPEQEQVAAAADETDSVPSSVLIFFDWDSAQVDAQSRDILDAVVENAEQNGADRIRLVGHADTSGPAAYNDKLSMRRAMAVQTALKSVGMPAVSYEIEADGEQNTLIPTGDGVRNPQNRRVRIVVEK